MKLHTYNGGNSFPHPHDGLERHSHSGLWIFVYITPYTNNWRAHRLWSFPFVMDSENYGTLLGRLKWDNVTTTLFRLWLCLQVFIHDTLSSTVALNNLFPGYRIQIPLLYTDYCPAGCLNEVVKKSLFYTDYFALNPGYFLLHPINMEA